MRIRRECGLLEAGLAACITTFCLSPVSAFPQLPQHQAELTNTIPDSAAVQRIQQQQQALFEAIERIQQDSDTALDRYTDAVLTQFNLLQDSFAAQQAKDIAAAEQFNRFTRNVVIVMIAGMFLSLMVIAWVPLWATNRMAKKIIEFGRARDLLASSENLAPGESLEVESALNRLEQRLLTLETEPSAARNAAEPDTPTAIHPPPAKAPMTPRVALAVGDSSALVFLPHDVPLPRWAGFRRQLTNLKKFWARSRSAS